MMDYAQNYPVPNPMNPPMALPPYGSMDPMMMEMYQMMCQMNRMCMEMHHMMEEMHRMMMEMHHMMKEEHHHH